VVRRHAEFYVVDRPLSSEVEAIEEDLGSDAFISGLIEQAPLVAFDDFFSLGSLSRIESRLPQDVVSA